MKDALAKPLDEATHWVDVVNGALAQQNYKAAKVAARRTEKAIQDINAILYGRPQQIAQDPDKQP